MKERINVKIWNAIKKFQKERTDERGILHYTASDFCTEEKLRQKMRFKAPEDLDFEQMDFYFGGMLSRVLTHAGVCAHEYKDWRRAYKEFRPYIAQYVGYESFISQKKNPMLRNEKAYALVRDMLSEACKKGAEERTNVG